MTTTECMVFLQRTATVVGCAGAALIFTLIYQSTKLELEMAYNNIKQNLDKIKYVVRPTYALSLLLVLGLGIKLFPMTKTKNGIRYYGDKVVIDCDKAKKSETKRTAFISGFGCPVS